MSSQEAPNIYIYIYLYTHTHTHTPLSTCHLAQKYLAFQDGSANVCEALINKMALITLLNEDNYSDYKGESWDNLSYQTSFKEFSPPTILYMTVQSI